MNALSRRPVIGLIRQMGVKRTYPSLILIHHDEKPQQGALFKMNTIRLLSNNPPINEGDQSKSQLTKLLLSRNLRIFIWTYLSVYATTLASLFGSLKYGLIDVNSLAVVREIFDYTLHLANSNGITSEIMNTISARANAILPKEYTPIEGNTQSNHFDVAFFVTELAEPFRLGVSCLLTPRVARFFGRHDDRRPV